MSNIDTNNPSWIAEQGLTNARLNLAIAESDGKKDMAPYLKEVMCRTDKVRAVEAEASNSRLMYSELYK